MFITTEPGTKRVRYGIWGRGDGYLATQIQFLESMGHLLADRAAAYPNDEASERFQQLAHYYLRLRNAISEFYHEMSRRPHLQPHVAAVSGRARPTRQRRR